MKNYSYICGVFNSFIIIMAKVYILIVKALGVEPCIYGVYSSLEKCLDDLDSASSMLGVGFDAMTIRAYDIK